MRCFIVELMRDSEAVERAEVRAENVVEAAKTRGPITIPYGDEPQTGEWIRVTHPGGIATTWFEADR